jgi:hypothetical protein
MARVLCKGLPKTDLCSGGERRHKVADSLLDCKLNIQAGRLNASYPFLLSVRSSSLFFLDSHSSLRTRGAFVNCLDLMR